MQTTGAEREQRFVGAGTYKKHIAARNGRPSRTREWPQMAIVDGREHRPGAGSPFPRAAVRDVTESAAPRTSTTQSVISGPCTGQPQVRGSRQSHKTVKLPTLVYVSPDVHGAMTLSPARRGFRHRLRTEPDPSHSWLVRIVEKSLLRRSLPADPGVALVLSGGQYVLLRSRRASSCETVPFLQALEQPRLRLCQIQRVPAPRFSCTPPAHFSPLNMPCGLRSQRSPGCKY